MQVRISKTISVNPQHVIFNIIDAKTLKTIRVTLGGKIKSDYTLDDTDNLLNGEYQK